MSDPEVAIADPSGCGLGNGKSQRDDGIARELRAPKPCCARIANGTWCTLADGHAGEHWSEARPNFGPLERRPAIWTRHRGLHCTDPDCCLPIGHTGDHRAPGVPKPAKKDKP